MLKFLLSLLLLGIVVNAEDKVEIHASSIDTKDNIVRAYDGINVIYKDYYLTADSATYNRATGELELFGNVHATKGTVYKILGNRATLNISKKEKSFHPFFMLERESQVWISADKGSGKEDDLDIISGVISGCDPNDPLWKMEFSLSEYNTDTKWLNLYNARIYIYDIPVFYTPYFGRSLSKERETGLLTPNLGLSNNEGFYYQQPIYIAPQNWWDLEFKPQIRTSRGSGLYSTIRFVDSEISKGEIAFGYFKEKDDFFKEQNLANDVHYGFNIKYENSDFLNQLFDNDFKGQSELFIDIKNMNDVDYINLSNNDSTQSATATQLLSRGNLFYNTDNHYIGAYFKYYKDLTIETNEDTLQILPTLHYHRYIETLLDNHLLYDIDIQANNIKRDINIDAIQTDLNIPLSLQTELFDEYLNLSYTSYLYAQYSNFSGSEKIYSGEYDNGLFARQYNTFELSSNLIKSYDEFSHSVGFGARYTLAGLEMTDGYYDYNKEFCSNTANKDNPRCDFYNITDVDEALQLDFTQYLFDLNGKEVIYHKLAQVIANKNSNFGELENELDYKVTSHINFYNNMFYNYEENGFSKILHRLSYKDSSFNIALSHLFKDTFLEEKDTVLPRSSYMTSSASYTYDSHYSYKVKMNYDLETSLKKSAEIGFLYKKRCWDFGLRYIENNRPVLTKNNISSSVYDRYIYFTIVFKPFMSGKDTDIDLELPNILKGT
ncbi:MAG: LPS assembly protein LptD [Campylobacterota bacterium]|nr:LPS assembly protein LptD [Campylobacterota bacterium]